MVELRRSGTTHGLVAAGIEPLPHASVIDGAIVDAGVACDAIRRLYKRLHVKTKGGVNLALGSRGDCQEDPAPTDAEGGVEGLRSVGSQAAYSL